MTNTVVDKLHSEFQEITNFLESKGELSFRNTAEETFRKALLITAASYFESKLADAVALFVEAASQRNKLVLALVKGKAISRQYHTWFSWDSGNANSFFAMFGDEFKAHMKDHLKTDAELQDSISAFIEIGRERNKLAHQDFGAFTLEKTADEIFAAYKRAAKFVDGVPGHLKAFSDSLHNGARPEGAN